MRGGGYTHTTGVTVFQCARGLIRRGNLLPVLQCKSDGSGAATPSAFCVFANLEQSLVSAGSRGSGFGRGHLPRSEDFLQAAVRRLAAVNDDIHRNTTQQTAYSRKQDYNPAYDQEAGFERATQLCEQTARDQTQTSIERAASQQQAEMVGGRATWDRNDD